MKAELTYHDFGQRKTSIISEKEFESTKHDTNTIASKKTMTEARGCNSSYNQLRSNKKVKFDKEGTGP